MRGQRFHSKRVCRNRLSVKYFVLQSSATAPPLCYSAFGKFLREDSPMTSRLLSITAAALFICAPVFAQQSAAPAAPAAKIEANPISTQLRETVADGATNTIAAAEEMPADKYTFSPTPQQITFAHLIVHATRANYGLCSGISGQAKPDIKVADTDGKDKLVAALKASFDYCTSSLANVDDSKLGDPLPFFGGRTISRGGMMMTLSAEYADHYSMAAMYLRLNGLLPPTAKK
jgi:DinB superfamily